MTRLKGRETSFVMFPLFIRSGKGHFMYVMAGKGTASVGQSRGMHASNAYLTHRKNVLVVEDQALLRFLAADMLEDAGYNPILAATADEAMDILSKGETVDLVFSDVNMPGRINGLDLAETVGARWPQIGVVLTSGAYLQEKRPLPNKAMFLPKPYEWEDVYRALKALQH
ncbi:MAG: response regulator [Gluconobacter sp.]|uniref:response regulator n=1 Tax=Gluconobacter sp. TaxID=1876758 RepID=UPI0039E8DA7D